MARKVDMSLRSFYIFNSTFCQKEGEEHKKILFYHPADIDIDTKIKDIGLSEAIIKFSGTFTLDNSCEALHTQKTTQIFNLPETDYWMVMTINVPYETKTKDGSEYFVEYKSGEVQDKIFISMLKQIYKMFRLFAGTFQMNFIGDTLDEKISNLKRKLELFYSKYLLTLKLNSCDIIDLTRSIQYLPLQKFLFLRVYNFINMIEETFPSIEKCIFLYNEQLVWSEINPNDLYSVYEYLVSTLFPKATQTELQGGSMRRSYSMDLCHYGTFISGPETFENCTKAPKVYIFNSKNEHSCYYLTVYRALSATICLFVNADSINEDFYVELHSFMGPQLSNIASEIGDTFTKLSPSTNSSMIKQSSSSSLSSSQQIQQQQQLSTTDLSDNSPKYLFLNELNSHYTGTIYFDNRRPKTSLIPSIVMNLLADLYKNDMDNDTVYNLNDDNNDVKINENELSSTKSNGKYNEIAIKSINDFWIVKKTSNWRQIYIIINNSKASLLDITNEAKKIIEQQTNNIYFEK